MKKILLLIACGLLLAGCNDSSWDDYDTGWDAGYNAGEDNCTDYTKHEICLSDGCVIVFCHEKWGGDFECYEVIAPEIEFADDYFGGLGINQPIHF